MEELYAEVDVLLTLEQYQQVVPATLASYLAYGTLIHFETISVPVSNISDLCETPHSLLKWEASSQTFCRFSQQVSVFTLMCMCF